MPMDVPASSCRGGWCLAAPLCHKLHLELEVAMRLTLWLHCTVLERTKDGERNLTPPRFCQPPGLFRQQSFGLGLCEQTLLSVQATFSLSFSVLPPLFSPS